MKHTGNETRPFHDVFMSRLRAVDVTRPESVQESRRLAEDANEIKIPADKIERVSEEVLNKMIDIEFAETAYVGEVKHWLTKANMGLNVQIDAYRRNGDLSDPEGPVVDLFSGVDTVGATANKTADEHASEILRHLGAGKSSAGSQVN